MASAARLRGVTRRFGRVTALDRADFDLAPGEVHGLLGENGAGKTTLARILAGLDAPDSGKVEIGGRPVRPGGAATPRALGVRVVHQHFSLVPRFTGLENVLLFDPDAWTRRGAARPEYRSLVSQRAARLGLAVRLDVPVADMAVAERQRIEILKALTGDTRVLLLDEPTAVLAPQEVRGLLDVVRQVAAGGAGVVLAAHKLDEVLGAADRVTVLRRGRRVLTCESTEVGAPELARAMVGERAAASVWGRGAGRGEAGMKRGAAEEPLRAARVGRGEAAAACGKAGGAAGEAVAALADVTVRGRGGGVGLADVSLEVPSGGIVGVAGVGGNGQRALAEVLAGVREPDEGTARLPAEVGWIPQDRVGEGLVGEFTVAENIALALHADGAWRKGPWLDWPGLRKVAAGLVRELDVRAESPEAKASTLSGGNQQKVVAGREFLRARSLLVAESPTRGLDVKAALSVRTRIAALAQGGPRRPGIVLISADLEEILELADSILVMVRGRLLPVAATQPDAASIGALMLSARDGA